MQIKTADITEGVEIEALIKLLVEWMSKSLIHSVNINESTTMARTILSVRIQ